MSHRSAWFENKLVADDGAADRTGSPGVSLAKPMTGAYH